VNLEGIVFPDTVGIVPRATWGAQAIDYPRMDGPLPEIRYIVIHHEAGTQPQIGTDFEKMRAIQNMHRNDPNRLWGDIGYHYGIGQHGNVMEGRPVAYAGAHVGRPHNFDSIGICLFGNFMNAMPTNNQMSKLIPLLAQLCRNHGVSPDNILGHRDMDSNYGYTSCPGDYFYNATNRLQDIRNAVKKKLDEDKREESSQLLSPAEARAATLSKINQYMNKMKWFEKLPYEITTWETEKNITDNPIARIDISVSEGIRKEVTLDEVVLEPQFNLNFSEGAPVLENPLSDWIIDQTLPEVEVLSMDVEFQNLANEVRNSGSVSVSYTMNEECYLITIYTIEFTGLRLSDGTIALATVQVSVGMKRINITGPLKVPVTNPTPESENRVNNILPGITTVNLLTKEYLTSRGISPILATGMAGAAVVLVIVAEVVYFIRTGDPSPLLN